IEFFSTNRGAELQRHNRSDSEFKQQHEILLSTLLLEQQLHSIATNEHKRRVNEHLDHHRLLLIFFSDIIFNTTSIVDSDSVKQVQVAIENLTKEIIAQQILFTQCHRDLEQDSNKVNEVLESAEYEWKSKTKSSQQQTDDLFSSTFISVSTTCYDDPTKDHSGRAACQGM
ncbi:unnamed protein product, partial [Rotaria magnacalcarata]